MYIHLYIYIYIYPISISVADTDDFQDRKEMESAILISLFHIHSLVNTETFISRYASEMTTAYF